jgi:SAM-dependent methyltransferase
MVAMSFHNVYEDERRAESYARLEFPGTYYLAYRDLPAIIAKHARGRTALDFGCGAGRWSRFLSKLGFAVTGVDISPDMVRKAREIDPAGDYRVIGDGDFGQFRPGSFDLIQSVFTFDNVPTREGKVRIFRGLHSLLNDDGTLILQIINFDRILEKGITSLPTISNPERKLDFKRDYSLDESSGLIHFDSILTVEENDRTTKLENRVDLYPLRAPNMQEILDGAGFRSISFFGGFNEETYEPADSFLLVALAKV